MTTNIYFTQKSRRLADLGCVHSFSGGWWFLNKLRWHQLGSVQFNHSVVSDSLWSHGLQHASPSPTPRVYSNSCPLSQWCYPTISSSVISFSSHYQSSPVLGSFQMSQFFASGSQSIGVSASALVLPMNIQDWFPLGWTGWISLQSKGLSRVFSNTTVQKYQFFGAHIGHRLWHKTLFYLLLSYLLLSIPSPLEVIYTLLPGIPFPRSPCLGNNYFLMLQILTTEECGNFLVVSG